MILTFFRRFHLKSFHVMYVFDMVLLLGLFQCHIRICARILNIISEVLYVPFRHYTNLLVTSILMLLLMQILYHCVDPYILNSTMMNLPIVALYLFLFLLLFRNVGILFLSILFVLQVVIRHFLLAHNLLFQVISKAILLLELEPIRNLHNIPLELVHPNIFDERIPNHVICNLLFFRLICFLLYIQLLF